MITVLKVSEIKNTCIDLWYPFVSVFLMELLESWQKFTVKCTFVFLTWTWVRMRWSSRACTVFCPMNIVIVIWAEPVDPLKTNGSYTMNRSFADAYSLNKRIPLYSVYCMWSVTRGVDNNNNGGLNNTEVRWVICGVSGWRTRIMASLSSRLSSQGPLPSTPEPEESTWPSGAEASLFWTGELLSLHALGLITYHACLCT